MANLSKSSSSSSSAGRSWRRRQGERARGIPKFCWCGEESVLKTSGTAKTPGRLFYSCPNCSDGDKSHLFTWTDECVVEEVVDLKCSVSELKTEMSDLRSGILLLERKTDLCKVMAEKNKKWCCAIL
ncbi:hypothetical protein N665_0104s0343 [Sinapis alba]|nr:hypothetical protein N665_0104s0343 [Sinapis alba]